MLVNPLPNPELRLVLAKLIRITTGKACCGFAWSSFSSLRGHHKDWALIENETAMDNYSDKSISKQSRAVKKLTVALLTMKKMSKKLS